MNYVFPLKSKYLFGLLIFFGVVLFSIGNYINHNDVKNLDSQITINHKVISDHSKEDNKHQDSLHNKIKTLDQIGNKPSSAVFVSLLLFFGISATALFFNSIQHVSNSGWSIVVLRVMEAIASYLPVGGISIILFVLLSSYADINHIYHWMESQVMNPKLQEFDLLLKSKEPFLNKPFFVIRTIFYVIGCYFFLVKIKNKTRKLDETSSVKDHKVVYNWSVGYIVFFALASALWAWDWIMSIDPHWYSTLYMWYAMVSCLVTAVAFIILFSIYLKKRGCLPNFNDNHLHDLAKFLFAFSLLWSYLWFAQFMLYWYANIAEEVVYFFGRNNLYSKTYFTMLIPNLILPLIVLISSKIKRNYKVVVAMSCIVILGHYLDYFNIIMPGTVGAYWSFGWMEIGSFLFFLGLFLYTVCYNLSKMNLLPKGNPYFHESETFEYPF